MKLTKEQSSLCRKQIFISGNDVIDFNKVHSLYSEIMLITASCGRGKTSYALDLTSNGLLAQVNQKRDKDYLPGLNEKPEPIKPEQVLFLTSRRAIKFQQLKNENCVSAEIADFKSPADEIHNFESRNRKGKIRITTAHQFGCWIKAGEIDIAPRLIILDELHSLFAETIFADDLLYTLAYIKEHYNDMIKIGLTATPSFLLDYIADDVFKFVVIDKELGAKYQAQNINCYIHTKAATVLENIVKPQISQKHKVIYYTMSATQCYTMAQQYGERAGFLISDYNEGKVKSGPNEGKLYRDIMNEQGIKQFILENERFPDNIDIIFINSACREGMNINDENVKTIICEAVDLITIEQIFGRVRKDTENFMVVCNFNQRSKNESSIRELDKFIETLKSAVDVNGEMGEQYGKQKSPNTQKFVYKYKGKYYLNKFAQAYLKYINDSYIQMANNEDCRYISVGNRKMLLSTDYFQQLGKYAANGTVDIQDLWKAAKEVNHRTAVDFFREIETEYLDRPIGTQEKKELCSRLSAVRAQGKLAGWTTVKRILVQNGYSVLDKKSDKTRYSIIQRG